MAGAADPARLLPLPADPGRHRHGARPGAQGRRAAGEGARPDRRQRLGAAGRRHHHPDLLRPRPAAATGDGDRAAPGALPRRVPPRPLPGVAGDPHGPLAGGAGAPRRVPGRGPPAGDGARLAAPAGAAADRRGDHPRHDRPGARRPRRGGGGLRPGPEPAAGPAAARGVEPAHPLRQRPAGQRPAGRRPGAGPARPGRQPAAAQPAPAAGARGAGARPAGRGGPRPGAPPEGPGQGRPRPAVVAAADSLARVLAPDAHAAPAAPPTPTAAAAPRPPA